MHIDRRLFQMPSFCRHNRLIQNCPICSREQSIELRPVVSPGTPASSRSAPREGRRSSPASPRGGVRVRRLERGADDGYRSPLVPGLKSSADAERLAEELVFGAHRLDVLASDPPGLYAEVAAGDGDLEERTWLAFLIAYLGPLDGAHPFASIEDTRRTWASGEAPALDGVKTGPRTAHDNGRGTRTTAAYRAWAGRSGSQAAAFTGETDWPAERRFARVFERLALPGFHRDARFDLLVTLGTLGVYELRAGALQFGGDNETTIAAKRVLGIGDPLLLERRAADLAGAAGLSLAALDVGFYNWGRGDRATLGLAGSAEPDSGALDATRAALEL
jgi:hypothetical protein